MTIFTIGFTKKSAETFFTRLKEAGVKRLVDIRLSNVSQLAGFTKKDDLRYFSKAILGIEYVHVPELAPTHEIMERFQAAKESQWTRNESEFVDLMRARHVEREVPRELLASACLLCSEEKPQHCHRRLVAEYVKKHWGDVEIVHLP